MRLGRLSVAQATNVFRKCKAAGGPSHSSHHTAAGRFSLRCQGLLSVPPWLVKGRGRSRCSSSGAIRETAAREAGVGGVSHAIETGRGVAGRRSCDRSFTVGSHARNVETTPWSELPNAQPVANEVLVLFRFPGGSLFVFSFHPFFDFFFFFFFFSLVPNRR